MSDSSLLLSIGLNSPYLNVDIALAMLKYNKVQRYRIEVFASVYFLQSAHFLKTDRDFLSSQTKAYHLFQTVASS